MNPIYHIDYAYLARRITPRRMRWFTFAIIGVSLISAIYGLILVIFKEDDLYTLTDSPFYTVLAYFTLILGLVAILLHFRTILGAVMLASGSVVNRRTISWDHVILTGISSRQMVWGKWWAVIRLTWRDFFWLGILRGSLIVMAGVFFMPRTDNIFYADDPVTILAPFQIISAFGLMFLLTMVNCLFTGAAGVVGSLNNRITGNGIRIIPVIITALASVSLVLAHLMEHGAIDVEAKNIPLMVLAYTMPTMLDNGSFVSSVLANPRDVGYAPLYFGVLIFSLVVYLWWTFALLFMGEVIMRLQGGND